MKKLFYNINNLYLGEPEKDKKEVLEQVSDCEFKAVLSGKIYKSKLLSKDSVKEADAVLYNDHFESLLKYKNDSYDELYFLFNIKVGKYLTAKQIKQLEEAFNQMAEAYNRNKELYYRDNVM